MLYEQVIALDNAEFIPTDSMSREDWLKLRQTGIGGSDAGAIMGLNKYATALTVFFAKKDFSKDCSDLPAVEWGNILEDPIRQKTKEELQIVIEKVPGMFRSKARPYMNANLDGLVYVDGEKEIAGHVVSGLGGHEIKTSRTGDGFSGDEVPDSYYAQVQHYMAVTGLSWFILTVFSFESYKGRHYFIARDECFIQDLLKSECIFWTNNVLADTPPAPTGTTDETELLKSMPMNEEILLSDEDVTLFTEHFALADKIKELEKASDLINAQILLKIVNPDAARTDKTVVRCGKYQCTVTKQVRKSIDTDRLKKAGLYDLYTKENVSNVLQFSKGKA